MKSFRYDFNFKELKYYLFGNNKCPKCNMKMKKIKCSKIVDGSMFNTVSVPLYIRGRSAVKYYYYMFHCPNCGSQYSLQQLANRNNKPF